MWLANAHTRLADALVGLADVHARMDLAGGHEGAGA